LNNTNNTVSLKILEAYTRDVGCGVARLDYESMDSLSASTGDVIEIRGKRRTVAKCMCMVRGYMYKCMCMVQQHR